MMAAIFFFLLFPQSYLYLILSICPCQIKQIQQTYNQSYAAGKSLVETKRQQPADCEYYRRGHKVHPHRCTRQTAQVLTSAPPTPTELKTKYMVGLRGEDRARKHLDKLDVSWSQIQMEKIKPTNRASRSRDVSQRWLIEGLPPLTPLHPSPPPSIPGPCYSPRGPPSPAAWLQLTCGMAHSKHLMELLLRPQKAISPNHSLLMPLTPRFHTQIRAHTGIPDVGEHTHTHTFCLINTCKQTTKPLSCETANALIAGICSNSCTNKSRSSVKHRTFQNKGFIY